MLVGQSAFVTLRYTAVGLSNNRTISPFFYRIASRSDVRPMVSCVDVHRTG